MRYLTLAVLSGSYYFLLGAAQACDEVNRFVLAKMVQLADAKPVAVPAHTVTTRKDAN